MEPRATYPPPPPSLIFLICIMVVMFVPSSEVMVRSDGIMHEYTWTLVIRKHRDPPRGYIYRKQILPQQKRSMGSSTCHPSQRRKQILVPWSLCLRYLPVRHRGDPLTTVLKVWKHVRWHRFVQRNSQDGTKAEESGQWKLKTEAIFSHV